MAEPLAWGVGSAEVEHAAMVALEWMLEPGSGHGRAALGISISSSCFKFGITFQVQYLYASFLRTSSYSAHTGILHVSFVRLSGEE